MGKESKEVWQKAASHLEAKAERDANKKALQNIKREKLDDLANLVRLYLREYPPDLGDNPIPTIKECLKRIKRKDIRRSELLEALDILDLLLGREVRRHFEARHNREKQLLELWKSVVQARP